MKSSLLYIPDISDFTKFVNETEIKHSQHVISELLELIIDSNELDMAISEIEGDAILFYKYQNVPPMHKLLSQVREMFLSFHNHLKQFENERICQCGACRTAVDLKLKIIAHAGELEFISVKDHKKLYGSDTILAHKLLKNNIEEDEYVLFTNSIFNKTGEQDIKIFHDWVKVNPGKINYDVIGDVEYKYISLLPLHKYIVQPPAIIPFEKINNPIVTEGIINKKIEDVFEIVSNFNYRLKWNKSLTDIIYDEDRVNRIGTKHRCVIGSQNINFETVSNDFGEGKIVYGERVVKPSLLNTPILKEFTTYYILNEMGNRTNLRIEVHYISYRFLLIITTPLFRLFMKKNIEKLFTALKELCENHS